MYLSYVFTCKYHTHVFLIAYLMCCQTPYDLLKIVVILKCPFFAFFCLFVDGGGFCHLTIGCFLSLDLASAKKHPVSEKSYFHKIGICTVLIYVWKKQTCKSKYMIACMHALHFDSNYKLCYLESNRMRALCTYVYEQVVCPRKVKGL